MSHKVDEILSYVYSITEYVDKGDVPSAILVLLVELGFQAHKDGFGYLRKAIYLKYNNQDLRMSAIDYEIMKLSGDAVGKKQIEQAMSEAIRQAWSNRDEEVWDLLFDEPEDKPGNYVLIARIACIMELWNKCRGGVLWNRIR